MGLVQRVVVGAGLAACLLSCGQAHAQNPAQAGGGRVAVRRPRVSGADETQPYSTPASSAEGVLQDMASRAAVIFAGTVTAVKKGSETDPSGSVSASVVEVDFLVDQATKGVTAGSVYAMREWAGLWRDSPRFVVGQRVLMLLHAPGPGGLSSPVDGLDGAIPVKTTASLPDAAPVALAAEAKGAENQGDTVDLRWLQSKTLKQVNIAADAPVASPGENFAGGLVAGQPLGASAASTTTTMAEPLATTALTHVLGLLASWQETGNVTR